MRKIKILVITDNERAFATDYSKKVRAGLWKYIHLYDHIRGIDCKKTLVLRKIYNPEKANKIQIIESDLKGFNVIDLFA